VRWVEKGLGDIREHMSHVSGDGLLCNQARPQLKLWNGAHAKDKVSGQKQNPHEIKLMHML